MSLDTFNCPHCEAQNDTTDWVEDWTRDGDEFEIECSQCEEYFDVRVSVSISYDVVES